MSEQREAALRTARRGYPIFPCWPGAKKPMVKHGFEDATTDLAVIERWWTKRPEANIALRTGKASGIVVLDIDPDRGGDDRLHALEREHGQLPRTLSVKTPRGGEHYYLRWPGVPVKCSAKGGVDVRGDGGYALIPPSIVGGRPYQIDDDIGIAAMPAWLVEMTIEPEAAETTATNSAVWVQMIRDGVPKGQRDVAMARIVGYLYRHYVDVDLVTELAHVVNETRFKPPMRRTHVERILDSIADREARR